MSTDPKTKEAREVYRFAGVRFVTDPNLSKEIVLRLVDKDGKVLADLVREEGKEGKEGGEIKVVKR